MQGPKVVTSYAQKSGQGTPMFSRPGKQTSAEYICFKEIHERKPIEEEEAENVPDEVKKMQVKNDLLGKDSNVLKDYQLMK